MNPEKVHPELWIYQENYQFTLVNEKHILYVFATQKLQRWSLSTLISFGFAPYFFNFFYTCVFFFLSSSFQMTRILDLFDIVSQRLKVLFISFDLFSPFFRWDNFYCSIFKFNKSFLCHRHYLIEPIQWLFKVRHIVFSSEIPIWFFFIVSISLHRTHLSFH